jgi:hypothetical protein
MKTTLSKSKYIAGLQCPRRLWLACHEPDLGTPASESLAAVFDQGAEIGRRARDLFPGGVLVDEEAWQHGQATARTRQLMADRHVDAIFEAASSTPACGCAWTCSNVSARGPGGSAR